VCCRVKDSTYIAKVGQIVGMGSVSSLDCRAADGLEERQDSWRVGDFVLARKFAETDSVQTQTRKGYGLVMGQMYCRTFVNFVVVSGKRGQRSMPPKMVGDCAGVPGWYSERRLGRDTLAVRPPWLSYLAGLRHSLVLRTGGSSGVRGGGSQGGIDPVRPN